MARRATSLSKKRTVAEETASPAASEQVATKARRSRSAKPDPVPEPSVADDSHGIEASAPALDDGPAGGDAQAHAMPAAQASAAQWDPGTDVATFDWPAIEQVAAADGANKVMAKLLLAARAEGENSRWPF